ncbi:MAG: hypothetical protein ABII06_06580 [Pseudomonadota bacterium]
METTAEIRSTPIKNRPLILVPAVLAVIGLVSFLLGALGQNPERAWQAYFINFLLWSSMAQGGLLFSAVMHISKARWGYPLTVLSDSFAAFFPISFILFLALFLGGEHVFPWLHHDLQGKEGWLNLPYLFTRDFIGLLILYGLGFAYLYHALGMRAQEIQPRGRIASLLLERWSRRRRDEAACRGRMSLFSVLYILAYALVLSLIGIDLVMSMEPHWVSSLFAPYHFIKAFYVGLGALVIVASIWHLSRGEDSGISTVQFHDLGKLFFAFCLLWGDFFYCQLVVIWYGNISEETSYIIQRVFALPWKHLSWAVLGLGFILPFVVLLNRKIKMKPAAMIPVCIAVLLGIWLEHLLLVGPLLNPGAASLPLGLMDGLITLGFLGLMALALTGFLTRFPPGDRSDEAGGHR